MGSKKQEVAVGTTDTRRCIARPCPRGACEYVEPAYPTDGIGPLSGAQMLIRLGPSAAVLGWLLLLAGIAYVLYGTYGTLAAAPDSIPRIVTGLIAVVVGSAVLRWVQRSRDGSV